jgi:predicted phosphodiesterase
MNVNVLTLDFLMELEIIGSVDSHLHYNAEQILALLAEQNTELSYGAAFMGRPGTCLYAGANDIIKLRTELDLNAMRARGYLNHTLEQEQKFAIHHPHKTWFLMKEADGKCKIGNICPRLTPLHILKDQTSQEITTKFVYLEKLYRCYFYMASHFSVRLDEGLSNFGIDGNEQLYYLDDDLYSWDNFISFAHILGVLIRNNSWLDENYAAILGCQLQQLISEFFEDSHTCVMVARKLRDVFIPDKNRRQILEIIIEQLQENKVITKKVQPYRQDCIAILSDIHANLPALEAVLAYLAAHNISQGMVLGDTVGYGPHPGECIDRLKQTKLQVIKGNHDHAAATGDTKRGMSSLAKWCIDWTIPRLTDAQRHWLNDLPLELDSADGATKNWQAVHGAPIDPNYFYAYVYQMTYEQNLDIMAERDLALCFHGHSHIQGLYVRNKLGLDDFVKPLPSVLLDVFRHALICPGAVGQPRDGCVGAQFAIYNQRTQELEFMVIDYDMEKVIKDMQSYGFPETLGQRLLRGA